MVRHYLISGRVQGVGYRAFVASRARALGLRGWVRNLRDGRVEMLVVDPPSELESYLKAGPPRALVERIEARFVEAADVWDDWSVAADGEVPWSHDS